MSVFKRNNFFPSRLLGTALIGSSLINLMMLTFKPTPAQATGSTCAGLNPYVCVYVYGSGGTVEELGASCGLVTQMCNYYAVWELYNSAGTRVKRQQSPTQRGCTYGRAWFREDTANINLGTNGSKVCVTWYEGGSQIGGRPCKRLG